MDMKDKEILSMGFSHYIYLNSDDEGRFWEDVEYMTDCGVDYDEFNSDDNGEVFRQFITQEQAEMYMANPKYKALGTPACYELGE